MQERDIGRRVAQGELHTISIRRDPVRSGWIAVVSGETGEIYLETKRGRDVRLFKTSDAVLRWCKRVGLSEVTVYL